MGSHSLGIILERLINAEATFKQLVKNDLVSTCSPKSVSLPRTLEQKEILTVKNLVYEEIFWMEFGLDKVTNTTYALFVSSIFLSLLFVLNCLNSEIPRLKRSHSFSSPHQNFKWLLQKSRHPKQGQIYIEK